MFIISSLQPFYYPKMSYSYADGSLIRSSQYIWLAPCIDIDVTISPQCTSSGGHQRGLVASGVQEKDEQGGGGVTWREARINDKPKYGGWY